MYGFFAHSEWREELLYSGDRSNDEKLQLLQIILTYEAKVKLTIYESTIKYNSQILQKNKEITIEKREHLEEVENWTQSNSNRTEDLIEGLGRAQSNLEC